MKGGPRGRRLLVGGAAALCAIAVVAASSVLFVWPATDRPAAADAVIVLGGDGHRDATGERLVREGVAPTLAVSVGSPDDPCYRRRVLFTLICFRPSPFTTQGEARWIAQNAKAKGWRSIVVVVSDPQATRARVRIRRCYGGPLQVVGVRLSVTRTIRDVFYEWGALLKAMTLQRTC